MKLNRLWILLTFSFLLLLTACSGGESATQENSTETNNEPASNTSTENANAQGGELVIEVLSEAVEMDPHGSNDIPSSNVQRNIFETLVVRNFETGEIEPLLAESWELSLIHI